jgi:DnaJ-class molecular chaperone
VLGGQIKIPTMEGDVNLTIPPGASSGMQLRLRGKGFKVLNKPTRGNQLVKIHIKIPKTITSHQRQLLEQLAASGI